MTPTAKTPEFSGHRKSEISSESEMKGTEIPKNTGREFMMDFQKYAQSFKKLMYSEDKVFIKGKYKESGSEEIQSGDDFWANRVWESGEPISAELIYRTYLEWFNRTRADPSEKERFFVSAEIRDNKEIEE